MNAKWPSLLALLVLCGLIAFAVWEMRDFGDPMDEHDDDPSTDGKIVLYDGSPNSTLVVNRTLMDEQFIDLSQDKETSTNNAVTAIVFDWRGFDTLGEATVLFSAVCGVLIALRSALPKKEGSARKGGGAK